MSRRFHNYPICKSTFNRILASEGTFSLLGGVSKTNFTGGRGFRFTRPFSTRWRSIINDNVSLQRNPFFILSILCHWVSQIYFTIIVIGVDCVYSEPDVLSKSEILILKLLVRTIFCVSNGSKKCVIRKILCPFIEITQLISQAFISPYENRFQKNLRRYFQC